MVSKDTLEKSKNKHNNSKKTILKPEAKKRFQLLENVKEKEEEKLNNVKN